jgi:transcription termination/antitermination protein NusA
VVSETQYNQAMQSGYNSLMQISGVGISLADALFEKGFYSAEELSSADIEDLVQIRGIGEEKARQLIINARSAFKAAEAQKAEAERLAEAEKAAQAEAAATGEQNPEDEPAPDDTGATEAPPHN